MSTVPGLAGVVVLVVDVVVLAVVDVVVWAVVVVAGQRPKGVGQSPSGW